MKIVSKAEATSFEDLKQINRSIEVHTLVSSPTWIHPNIAVLHGAFHAEHHLCFLMEHAGRITLYQWLAAQGQQDTQRAMTSELRRLIVQVTGVIAHLHAGPRVVHCDIRPDNYRVQGEGSEIVVKLVDFDLACVQDPGSFCRTKAGTMPFVAPEVILTDEYDGFCADSWSLGVTLLEILCGVQIVERLLGVEGDLLGSAHMVSTSMSNWTAMRVQRLFRKRGTPSEVLAKSAMPQAQPVLGLMGPQLDGLLELGCRRRLTAGQV